MVANEGEIIPPLIDTGFAVPVTPVINVPPVGLTKILYGEELLHRLGIAVIVGIGGLIPVIEIVFVVGQFTKLGVTITVYIVVTF